MRVMTGVMLLTAAPAVAAAQVVTGVVRADSTGRPLANVEVSIEGAKDHTTSGPEGRYSLVSPTGKRVIVFRMAGYQQVRMGAVIAKRDTVRLDAILVKQSAQELPEVGVTAKAPPVPGSVMAAFEERRRLGIGTFIDSTELRRYEGRRLGDLLRGRTSVRIIPYQESPTFVEYRAASPTGLSDDGIPCWVSVFLDGIAIYKARNNAMRPPDLNRDFDVNSLMAIEYYRSPAQVPPEYGTGRDSDCGLLLFWTRRGS